MKIITLSLNNLRITHTIILGSMINSPICPASAYDMRITGWNIPESMHLNPEKYKKGSRHKLQYGGMHIFIINFNHDNRLLYAKNKKKQKENISKLWYG